MYFIIYFIFEFYNIQHINISILYVLFYFYPQRTDHFSHRRVTFHLFCGIRKIFPTLQGRRTKVKYGIYQYFFVLHGDTRGYFSTKCTPNTTCPTLYRQHGHTIMRTCCLHVRIHCCSEWISGLCVCARRQSLVRITTRSCQRFGTTGFE